MRKKALPSKWDQIVKVAITVDFLELLQTFKQVRQPPHRGPILAQDLLRGAFRNSP